MAAPSAHAQPGVAAPSAVRPSARPPVRLSDSSLTISLVTMGVGAEVWERFGHNAIVVQDRLHGTSIAYNYGLFDFRQENFVLRFIQGRMLYWMEGFDAAPMVEHYIHDNRTIWLQELNLSPEQSRALADFLAWNARPENRFYHYDYYKDNCSTRVRDAIDRVLGGQMRAETDTIPTGTTYRSHTERLTESDPALYSALLLALGEPADHELSAWEEMFLPVELHRWLAHVNVRGPDGRPMPLVRAERTLYLSSRPLPPARPPHWLLAYFAAGVAIGAGLVVLARRGAASRRAARGFAWLAGGWTLVIGIAGGILAFLWAFTDHTAAYRNENLFQANLLLLPLALLAPRLARGRAWARRPAVTLAWAVAVVSVMGLLVKLLPGFDQANAEVLACAVPANLGLGLGVWMLARRAPGVKG